jgi:aspartate racemase
MSWVSTAMYYEAINKGVAKSRGGLSSAPLLIESLDFAVVEKMQAAGEWDALADLVIASAKRLEQAGAEGLILCSNTAHKMHDWIDGAIKIPMLHIGDVTAERLSADGVKRAGLIGTRFTMTENFYRDRLEAQGITVSVPEPGLMREIDRIIFEELARGIVSRVSQRTLKTCIFNMAQARNQAVILGCTELVMLTDPGANVIPVYDTTALHSRAAVQWILGDDARQEQPEYAAAAS